MIVVDASALVAIADEEPEADRFLDVLGAARGSAISAINVVETGIVLIGRQRLRDIDELDRWLDDLEIQVDLSNATHAAALTAYLSFGRGYHRARLNLADCFAYALAKALDAPLLYKGDDFAFTDIRSALQPT
ncbi:MAG TPA: type II toxin-antitoxin system VapC family toxin [Caulobacteraceae bacterium]|nr:type II toxin-antitoxin system VapC family toxin [Caulobacteraceae bacterium]